MRGRADYSPVFLVIIEVLSVLGCTLRPSPYRRLIFVPIAALSIYSVFFTASNDLIADYSQGLWIVTNLFIVSDLVLLTDIQNVFRKVGQKEPVSEAPFLERLKWGFDLLTSPRGFGWMHGTPVQPTTRIKSIGVHLVKLLQCLAVYDIAQILFSLNPSFEQVGGPPFWTQPWWLQPTTFAHICASLGSIGATYAIGNIFLVAVGLAEPMEWPFTFGHVWEAYTVRRAWVKLWHQNMRRFLTAHVEYLATIFHLPKRSISYRYFQLYVAFAISSIIHFCGDYMLLQDVSEASGALKFFFSQAFVITFETGVIYIAKRLGLTRVTWFSRLVGYVWVITWFSLALPVWIEPHVRIGFIGAGRYESLIARACRRAFSS